MRIEIIVGAETVVHTLPEQVEFLGLTLENTDTTLNISTGFPGMDGNSAVACTDQVYPVGEGLTLIAHMYTLGGKAKVLSWKPYPNFLFYDLYFGDVHIKVYG